MLEQEGFLIFNSDNNHNHNHHHYHQNHNLII